MTNKPENTSPITVLDGGMGQELLRRSGLALTPLWSAHVMSQMPNLVTDLHVDFINAGAQIITINAYSATPERLEREHRKDEFPKLQLLALEAARAARDKAARPGIRIGGCLPPLMASYRPEVAPEYDQCLEIYRRVVEVQAPHVDLIQCETMSSIKEAKASATAAKEAGLPVWSALSVQDNDSGLLRSGEPLSEALEMLKALGVDAVLLNCSKPEAISLSIGSLSMVGKPFGAYANGFTSIDALEPGGTVVDLGARLDLTPENYAEFAMQWVNAGATIVGGCCEVGPDHIACISNRLKQEGRLASL